MPGQKREHVDIPDTLELLFELGAHGGAVVVAGDEIAWYPLPPAGKEAAV